MTPKSFDIFFQIGSPRNRICCPSDYETLLDNIWRICFSVTILPTLNKETRIETIMQETETLRKRLLKNHSRRVKEELLLRWYCSPKFHRKIQKAIVMPRTYAKHLLRNLRSRPDDVFLSMTEAKLTDYLLRTLKEDDVFYDIGAHRGFYTKLARKFCKEVHAFEPNPVVFHELQKAAGDNVFLNNLALGDEDGVTDLHVRGGSERGSISQRLVQRQRAHRSATKSQKYKVAMTTLDSYVYIYPKPTVLKIDVEGAELMVLNGGRKFLQHNSPTLSLEVWRRDKNGDLSFGAVKALQSFGFQPYFISSQGRVQLIRGNVLDKISAPYENIIFRRKTESESDMTL